MKIMKWLIPALAAAFVFAVLCVPRFTAAEADVCADAATIDEVAAGQQISIVEIIAPEYLAELGDKVTLPGTVTVRYSDETMYEPVAWNKSDSAAIKTSAAGTYTVNGTVTFSRSITAGGYAGKKSASVKLTVKVMTEGVLGDTDYDSKVTILDATRIQRSLAKLISENEVRMSVADTDMDDIVTILDATHIQRYLAKISGTYYIGMTLRQIREKFRDERVNALLKEYKPVKGVDISTFNGDVDMKKLKAAGYSFVMIRMGFGSDYTFQDDNWFERNVAKAEAAGLDWGAYLYSYALNVSDAKSEVQHALRLLKGKHPTMPIAFDIEDDTYKDKHGMPDNKTLQNICYTFLSGIRDAGYYPILYSNLYWLNHRLNDPKLLSEFDLWVAQWYTELQYKADNVGMWQFGGEINYIESNTIPGLNGPFDKDYCFKNYPLIITEYGYNNFEEKL